MRQDQRLGDDLHPPARAYLKAGKAEDFRRCRDLVRKAGLDPANLDPTDARTSKRFSPGSL